MAPVIDSVHPASVTLQRGQSALVTVEAHDPDVATGSVRLSVERDGSSLPVDVAVMVGGISRMIVFSIADTLPGVSATLVSFEADKGSATGVFRITA